MGKDGSKIRPLIFVLDIPPGVKKEDILERLTLHRCPVDRDQSGFNHDGWPEEVRDELKAIIEGYASHANARPHWEILSHPPLPFGEFPGGA